jgi:hypothetical protein
MTIRKKHNREEYEGDMARICEKWRSENKNKEIEFSSKMMVKKRDIKLTGLGRTAYSKKGYEDIKIPVLLDMRYIYKLPNGKFKLTLKGIKYCERNTIV